jgi:hypothetical protein
MERIRIELLAEGDIFEKMQAASDFVSYLNDSLKSEEGNASGPIEERSALHFLDQWQHILVEIVPYAKAVLIQVLVAYASTRNAKIKIRRGTTSIEIPSRKVSDEEIKKIIDSITK